MRHQVSGFSLVVIGIILGLFWGGVCGGGAEAAQQGTVSNRIHVSTPGGVVSIPADAQTLIREIIFTPNGPTDIVHQIIIDGTYDKVGAETGTLIVEVLDANDSQLASTGGSITTPGTGVPYRLTFSPITGTSEADVVYPSNTYKIRFTVSTISVGTFSGQINSTRFRVITSENVSVENPSGRISG